MFTLGIPIIFRLLFWSDSNRKTIEQSDLSGGSRTTLLRFTNRVPTFLSIDYEQDKLYILDKMNNDILAYEFLEPKQFEVVVSDDSRDLVGLALFKVCFKMKDLN